MIVNRATRKHSVAPNHSESSCSDFMAADPALSGLPEGLAGFADDVQARDGDVAQGAIVQMGKLPAAAAARAPDPDRLDHPGEQSGDPPVPPWLREYFG